MMAYLKFRTTWHVGARVAGWNNNRNGDKDNSRNILVIINVIRHFFVHQLAQLYGRIVYADGGRLRTPAGSNCMTVSINVEI